MSILASRINRTKPSPSSMAGQRARELRASGRDIVALTAGEPDFDTPDNVIEAVKVAMAASRTKYTRSEEHTSELQSLMRISYAGFCLKKKKQTHTHKNN